MLDFSPHLTSASALSGERGKPKIVVFSLMLHAVLNKCIKTKLILMIIISTQSWENST